MVVKKKKSEEVVVCNVNAARYGERYWLVEHKSGRQWIHADGIEVKDGCLILARDGKPPNAVFASGLWVSCHAASQIDGGMVAVEHVERR